jgi:hypothetical protein
MTRVPTIEETPEQVLARLERYATSLRAPSRPVVAPAPAPVASVPAPAPLERTWSVDGPAPASSPANRVTAHDLRHVAFEAMGYMLFFVCAFAAIVLFQRLDRTFALVLVLAFVIGGAIATFRRVPLALWWTLGFMIGGVIARLS